MSASLVGSEMCIRDRLENIRGNRDFQNPACAARPAAPATPAVPHTSVSYTHLTLPTICSV
eukprot:9805340-Alexandrium_andersonii.AAC.1